MGDRMSVDRDRHSDCGGYDGTRPGCAIYLGFMVPFEDHRPSMS